MNIASITYYFRATTHRFKSNFLEIGLGDVMNAHIVMRFISVHAKTIGEAYFPSLSSMPPTFVGSQYFDFNYS